MAINYYSSFGRYTNTETDCEGVTHQYTEDIHNANCMCCGIYHFSDNGRNFARVMWKLDNITHMNQRISEGLFASCDNFTFDAKSMPPVAWHLVKALAKLGKHITIN